MTRRTRVLVAGATGYAGGEAIRLLLGHPAVELCDPVGSPGHPERRLADIHPHLRGLSDLVVRPLEEDSLPVDDADVVFLATPDEVSVRLVPGLLRSGVRVVDLSGGFRLPDPAVFRSYYGYEHPCPELLPGAVYSIPEILDAPAATLAGARLVANPGCYPTCVSLALAPFLRAGVVAGNATIVCDAKSGTTGAGRKARTDLLHAEMEGNLRPYGLPRHRHTPEIRRALDLPAGRSLVFAPHVFGAHRGMLATCYLPLARPLSTPEARGILEEFYADARLVRVLPPGSVAEVRGTAGTPFADVAAIASEDGGTLVVTSAIDNLLKGASSQAVQNMNLMLGLDPAAGLLPAIVRRVSAGALR